MQILLLAASKASTQEAGADAKERGWDSGHLEDEGLVSKPISISQCRQRIL